MTNKNKNVLAISFAVLLLIAGLGVVLDIFNISLGSLSVLAFGICFLIGYFVSHKKVYLHIGTYFALIGLVIFLVNAGIVDWKYFLALITVALSLGLFVSYFASKKQILLFAAEIIMFVAARQFIFILVDDSAMHNGYSALVLGILFVILFILQNKNYGYFPAAAAVVFYLLGFLNLAAATGMIDKVIFKVLCAAVLIICGLLLFVYVIKKNIKVDKYDE